MGAVLSHMSTLSHLHVTRRAMLTTYLPLLGVSYIFYIFGLKPFLSPLRKMPGLPYNPLFGNVREAMRGEAMVSSIRWVAKYGGILRYYTLLGREMVLIADPEALRHVLVTHCHKYGRPSPRNLPLGKSVLFMTGDEHKARRLLLNPVFTLKAIKGYKSVFEEYAQKLITYWEEEISTGTNELPVQEDLFRTTFDVFGKAVLGEDFDSLMDPNSLYVNAFKTLLSMDSLSFTNALPILKYLPTKQKMEKKRSKEIVDEILNRLMKKKRHLLETGDVSATEAKRDLLGCLLLARDTESGRGLTAQEVYDELITLIFAGYETTAMTISWILLLLAQNPEEQAKLRREVESSLEWEKLESMKYLDCIIKEGQRLYPAAATFTRIAKENDYIGQYFIPKGTPLMCHIGCLMRNASIWTNPEKFMPDRFLEMDPNQKLYTFIPFGAGPTTCLGHIFARMQMKVILSSLVKHFQFETVPGLEFRRKHRITLKCVPPIRLSMKSCQ